MHYTFYRQNSNFRKRKYTYLRNFIFMDNFYFTGSDPGYGVCVSDNEIRPDLKF